MIQQSTLIIKSPVTSELKSPHGKFIKKTRLHLPAAQGETHSHRWCPALQSDLVTNTGMMPPCGASWDCRERRQGVNQGENPHVQTITWPKLLSRSGKDGCLSDWQWFLYGFIWLSRFKKHPLGISPLGILWYQKQHIYVQPPPRWEAAACVKIWHSFFLIITVGQGSTSARRDSALLLSQRSC